MANNKVHHGRNIKRLREIMGIKQEALAIDMGDDWSQKKISMLEAKEDIDDKILEQVAKALNIPVDAIENYNDEAAIFNIQNNYDGSNSNAGSVFASGENAIWNINPIDKWMEALAENKALYERLLQSEREKVELLERMMKK